MTSAPRRQLAAAAEERRQVLITRVHPYGEAINGYPLALGRKLLLLHEVNADLLLPDGFSAVRIQDIATVRAGEWEQFVGRVLADESRLPAAEANPQLRLGSWAHLLADLHARGERVSVECEPHEDAFFLGAILRPRRDDVEIRPIDPAGRWEEEIWSIAYRDITRVRFGTRYIDVFSRYAGELP